MLNYSVAELRLK